MERCKLTCTPKSMPLPCWVLSLERDRVRGDTGESSLEAADEAALEVDNNAARGAATGPGRGFVSVDAGLTGSRCLALSAVLLACRVPYKDLPRHKMQQEG